MITSMTIVITVLILVLVEYAFWRSKYLYLRRLRRLVLILVLVEYAFWHITKITKIDANNGLNPCFSGICFLTPSVITAMIMKSRVLILVLVEYAFWLDILITYSNGSFKVLILVLVEYAFWRGPQGGHRSSLRSLNPCFSGICFLTSRAVARRAPTPRVLILVLVEYAFWLFH